MAQRRHAVEFGDFQTPLSLAREICASLREHGPVPQTIVEPTCGVGNFLVAARESFGQADAFGFEINEAHLEVARERLGGERSAALERADFFAYDWPRFFEARAGPILVLGNPPWVTSAQLGSIGGDNLPPKSNARGDRGLDARTGKANFDISEWMLARLLEVLEGRDARIAMLIKTSVARKALAHAWAIVLPIADAQIYPIDAKRHFDVSVDACLFTCRTDRVGPRRCEVYSDLSRGELLHEIGYDESGLIADLQAREATSDLAAHDSDTSLWRSGIKHDCAKVLELRPVDDVLHNGLGERVEVEDAWVFPLCKSSDVAGGRGDAGKRLIVTQRSIGQVTEPLQHSAPQLWRYLSAHASRLDARKSSIYRGKPRFSIFGVGPYTFAPWKVAISGLYKRLHFSVHGPVEGKPVVFDDTVYFLGFDDEAQARHAHRLLCSDLARRFYASFIFWDAKRPITATVLRKLSLQRLAQRV